MKDTSLVQPHGLPTQQENINQAIQERTQEQHPTTTPAHAVMMVPNHVTVGRVQIRIE